MVSCELLEKHLTPLKGFEGVAERHVRDRSARPRAAIEKQNKERCPKCQSWLNDEFKGKPACENCWFVKWRN